MINIKCTAYLNERRQKYPALQDQYNSSYSKNMFVLLILAALLLPAFLPSLPKYITCPLEYKLELCRVQIVILCWNK
jgi:hypothetical protein